MLYRGITYSQGIETELLDGRVHATPVDVYELSELPDEKPGLGKSIGELPLESAETVDIVGGFTDAFGTANHFAAPSSGHAPVLLGIENGGNLGVREVEYNIDWMNQNPGVLGHIETLANAEIRYNGKLYGLADGGSVQTWGERAENRASSQTYIRESEYVANAPYVDIATYVEWAVMIVNMSAVVPTFQGVLDYHTDLNVTSMYYKYEDDPDGAAELLWDVFSSEVERFVGAGNFYVVMADRRANLMTGDDVIGADDVAGVYGINEPDSIYDTPIPTA